jgi:hypothetical protein
MALTLVRSIAALGTAVLFAIPSARAATAVADGAVDGAWQHHRVKFDYVGRTTRYTCSGLEGQVSQVLRYLGARSDIKVHAGGCPGADGPAQFAWVDVQFDTLAPAGDSAAGPTVKARWTRAELTPRYPSFNDDGNCELFESMKSLILQNFTLRGFDYRTSCVPHTLSPNGFDIRGEVLKQTIVKSN